MPALVIIGLCPLGFSIRYDGGMFRFAGRIAFVSVPFGREEKSSRFGKQVFSFFKKVLSHPDGEIFLKNAYTTLRRIAPRIWIPYLKLHVLAAGSDPAKTAVAYGTVGMLLVWLQSALPGQIGKTDLRAEADFGRESPEVSACVRIRILLYQVLYAAVRLWWGIRRERQKLRRGV